MGRAQKPPMLWLFRTPVGRTVPGSMSNQKPFLTEDMVRRALPFTRFPNAGQACVHFRAYGALELRPPEERAGSAFP